MPVMPPGAAAWIRLMLELATWLAEVGAVAVKSVTSSAPLSTAVPAVTVGWKLPSSTSRVLPADWLKTPCTARVAASSMLVVAPAAVV